MLLSGSSPPSHHDWKHSQKLDLSDEGLIAELERHKMEGAASLPSVLRARSTRATEFARLVGPPNSEAVLSDLPDHVRRGSTVCGMAIGRLAIEYFPAILCYTAADARLLLYPRNKLS